MLVRMRTMLAAMIVSLVAAPIAMSAEKYPNKPIRVIVPYPAGGSGDFVGRLLGAKLTEAWGEQIVLDNRPGASGMLGTEIVARSPRDGYTLLLATEIQFAINPLVYSKLAYDPEKDFEPISLAAYVELALAVPSSLRVNSLSELVALAKSKPGKLNYGSAGAGSTHHLAAELLKSLAGIDVVHVPYKGSGQALPDLLTGQIDMMFFGVSQALPSIKSGQLVGLAVGSTKRLAAVPQIPTVAETYPGFEVKSWWCFFAPAGTPREIVNQLSAEINKVVQSPSVSERFAGQGLEPVGTTPEELATRLRAERQKWGKVVQAANIKVD